MILQHTEPDFSGQDIYIGLDVHKSSWKVSILTAQYEHRTFTQPPSPDALVRYLHRCFPGARYHAVYEAGYCGFWIHDELCDRGINCMVVHAADVPTTDKEKKHKTNPVDARKLARHLRAGELHAIYVPSREQLEDRSLIRTRHTLAVKVQRCKNQISSALSFYGIMLPDEVVHSKWSRRFLAWLKGFTMATASGNQALAVLLKELASLREILASLTYDIQNLARRQPYRVPVENLKTISGISTLNAMVFLTELVTVNRFHNLDRLASYVGLVPGECSSGDQQTITDLTHRRNHFLRHVIIEAAWVAVRKDPVLMQAFNVLCRRMNKKQAIIRIARKLLNRVHFVLKNQQPIANSIKTLNHN